jgi:hypothetical protein
VHVSGDILDGAAVSTQFPFQRAAIASHLQSDGLVVVWTDGLTVSTPRQSAQRRVGCCCCCCCCCAVEVALHLGGVGVRG